MAENKIEPRECKYSYNIMGDIRCDLTNAGRNCKVFARGIRCSKFTPKTQEK